MTHAAPDRPRPGERMVRAGAAVFAVGLAAVAVALLLFVTGRADVPLWLTLLAVLLPLGLAVALVGLLRAASAARRQ